MAIAVLICSTCAKVEEPITLATDSPDKDVSIYLDELLQSARAMSASALARGRLGMAYDVNGLRDEALITYGQAEALDPSDFRWPYFSAQLVAETGEHEQALEVLQRAQAIDANYPPAWLWRGSWLLKAGHPEDALVAFEQAVELDAGPAASFGRAQALIAMGQHTQAIKILEPIARTSDHPYIYRTLGEALRALGRTEEARLALAQGKDTQQLSYADARLEQRNTHKRGHTSFQLAQTLSASGSADEALTILKRLQTHHPEHACGGEQGVVLACNLMNSSSIAYDRLGLPTRALETIQRGLTLNAEYIPFHLTIANLYRQQGDLASALNHMDRAIELNPARGYAHEQRGRLLFGLARFDEAKTAFETALQLKPEKRTTLFYLGLTEVELDSWADAVARFEDVVRIEPDFALGYVFFARSLGEAGRIKDARQAQLDARKHGADPAQLRITDVRLRELEAQLDANE